MLDISSKHNPMESMGNELVKSCVVLVTSAGSHVMSYRRYSTVYCKECKVINLVSRPFPVDSA
jgi:hypothetical protein